MPYLPFYLLPPNQLPRLVVLLVWLNEKLTSFLQMGAIYPTVSDNNF